MAEAAEHININVDDMKQCLANGWPFILGFDEYARFEDTCNSNGGWMPMPQVGEKIIGGHCVCIVGYDDACQVLVARNSWGSSFGDHGFFYMPYDFVTNDNCDGAYCITWVSGDSSSCRKSHIVPDKMPPLHHRPQKRQ